MADEFIEGPPGKDCSKFDGGWGLPMTDYEFIWYGNVDEDKYPDDACKPYYHKYAQIDNFKVNVLLDGALISISVAPVLLVVLLLLLPLLEIYKAQRAVTKLLIFLMLRMRRKESVIFVLRDQKLEFTSEVI